jgi:hypothetical protein
MDISFDASPQIWESRFSQLMKEDIKSEKKTPHKHLCFVLFAMKLFELRYLTELPIQHIPEALERYLELINYTPLEESVSEPRSLWTAFSHQSEVDQLARAIVSQKLDLEASTTNEPNVATLRGDMAEFNVSVEMTPLELAPYL